MTVKEKAIAKRCLIYEHQKILKKQLNETHVWRCSSKFATVNDDELMICTATAILPNNQTNDNTNDHRQEWMEDIPTEENNGLSPNDVIFQMKDITTNEQNGDFSKIEMSDDLAEGETKEGFKYLYKKEKKKNIETINDQLPELFLDIISIIKRFITKKNLTVYKSALKNCSIKINEVQLDTNIISDDDNYSD